MPQMKQKKTLTFYADVSDLYEEVCFYVPYPTGTISAGSSVRLEDAGGGFVIFENDNLKAIPVEKNRITVTPLQTLPTPSLQLTLNYEDAEGEVKNPERGLYDHVILHYAGGSTPSNLNGTDDNNSLVFTHFYLDDFKNNGSVQDISDAALTAIGQVLETVRTAGKKAIVRFAYDEENYMDAGPAGILRHLEQLSPVLHANEDVIYVVQAGFLGRWGEWHDSPNFPTLSKSGYTVNNYEDYSDVIEALLTAVPESRQVALRVPDYKRYYLNPTSIRTWTPITSFEGTDPNHRLSFHNDAFRGSEYAGKAYDLGTFRWENGDVSSSTNLDMWESQSAFLAVGGEPAKTKPDGTYVNWSNTQTAIREQHMSYLNGDTSKDIMDYWLWELGGDDNAIRKAFGYRLWLRSSELYHESLGAGETVVVRFTLENSGAAPVINKRPMKLVRLRDNGGTIERTVLIDNVGDLRMVASDDSFTYTVLFKIPAGGILTGDQLALWLPDEAPSLRERAVYSIRLANTDTPSNPSVFSNVTWVTTGAGGDEGGYNVFYTFP